MDFYLPYSSNQCLGANHWLNLDAHSPPDHGGHILDDRDDLGNYSWIALTGIHDSNDTLADDPELEKTGTYALCFARYNGEDNCTTWKPVPEDYVFMPNVQIHVRLPHFNPKPTHNTHTYTLLFGRSSTNLQVRKPFNSQTSTHTHTLSRQPVAAQSESVSKASGCSGSRTGPTMVRVCIIPLVTRRMVNPSSDTMYSNLHPRLPPKSWDAARISARCFLLFTNGTATVTNQFIVKIGFVPISYPYAVPLSALGIACCKPGPLRKLFKP